MDKDKRKKGGKRVTFISADIPVKKGQKKSRYRIFSEEKVAQLIEKGRQRGFVTLSEILYLFPLMEKDVRGLEQLYDRFDREGVEVKEAKAKMFDVSYVLCSFVVIPRDLENLTELIRRVLKVKSVQKVQFE